MIFLWTSFGFIDARHREQSRQFLRLWVQGSLGCTMWPWGSQGRVKFGFCVPKIERAGTFNATARCTAMESGPTSSFWFWSQQENSKRVPLKVSNPGQPRRIFSVSWMRSLVQTSTILCVSLRFWISFTQLVTGHLRSGWLAPGWITIWLHRESLDLGKERGLVGPE